VSPIARVHRGGPGPGRPGCPAPRFAPPGPALPPLRESFRRPTPGPAALPRARRPGAAGPWRGACRRSGPPALPPPPRSAPSCPPPPHHPPQPRTPDTGTGSGASGSAPPAACFRQSRSYSALLSAADWSAGASNPSGRGGTGGAGPGCYGDGPPGPFQKARRRPRPRGEGSEVKMQGASGGRVSRSGLAVPGANRLLCDRRLRGLRPGRGLSSPPSQGRGVLTPTLPSAPRESPVRRSSTPATSSGRVRSYWREPSGGLRG